MVLRSVRSSSVPKSIVLPSNETVSRSSAEDSCLLFAVCGAAVLPPLLERHQRSIDILRKRSEEKDGTVFFDITDLDLEGYNKFIPYYLFPDSIYNVGLSKSSFRVKVSVGSNPWSKREPTVNLAKVCERYGGGGHARVGAISFDVNQSAAAHKAALEIVEELRASVR